jgi:P4 family phage/plasmid primase-like protien
MTGPHGPDLTDLNAAATALTPSDPTATGSTYGRTGWDNGRRLALYEASNLRYINDRDVWYRWCQDRWCTASRADLIAAGARTALRVVEEARYVEDDDDRARHMAWANSSLQPQALREFANMGAAVDDLRCAWENFDTHVDLLNAPNCTLNVRTLAWHPHTRDDMLTQMCPTPYVPTAQSKKLDDFLERFLPDKEEREYTLQTLAVSGLTSGNRARRMILLLGPTSSGKSTIMDLVLQTFGRDYVSAVNPSIFRGNLEDKPRPDLLRLLKSRLALAFEASDRWELHGDQIKRMTGGDPITARGMRSDVMNETVASFVPIIIANAVPSIHNADDALRRRLVGLSMDVTVPEDSDDEGRLRQELVGDEGARRALLARLVRTFADCDGRVLAPMPARFAELTMEMFAKLDDVDEIMRVLKDEGSIYPVAPDTHPSNCVRTSMLYRCYTAWLQRHGTPQMKRDQFGPKQFTQRLKSLGYEIIRSDGSRLAGWCLGDTSTTNSARF